MAARSRLVGPFELREIVGRGGMGVVWSAVHRVQRTPVAFKVLTHEAARRPAYLRAFRNEVRAAAGLSHPGIVEVYEHGEIEQMLDEAGELRPGNPYLAMEWVGGGSLVPTCGQLRWPALRSVLRQLLDALAHAHARGIVHRDLKPANVLRSPGGGWLKLTDFGVAGFTGIDERPAQEGVSGTPEYMAPEQIEGRWRDTGPATDLYGLGCMAWELCTGQTPFEGVAATQIMTSHLLREPPAFEPRHAVPEGFELWLRRLLAKAPADRYARAADAAWALMQLGAVTADDEAEAADDAARTTFHATISPPPHTLVFGTPIRHQTTLESPPAALPAEHAGTPSPVSPFEHAIDATTDAAFRPFATVEVPFGPPPMAQTWRRPEPPPWSARLMGAGLGLFGLRTVPFVGREAERDALWAELAAVHAERRARLVLITGAAGTGKSRLAEWLGESAHELGVGTPLWVRCTAEPGPTPPLAEALLQHHGLAGLSRVEMAARLASRGVTRPAELAAWLAGPGPGELELPRATERQTMLRRALENIAAVRPVVLVLDDIQWSVEALDLARHVLDAQFFAPSPLLLVLTAEDERLAEAEPLQRLLRDLLTRPCTRRVMLGPIAEADRPALARSLLGLSEELTARLVNRAAGNPQLAVQLVSEWVARDLLVSHEHGFRFRKGAAAEASEVPATLRAAWDTRLWRALDGQPPVFGEVLERAAALGADVDLAEWEAACAATGLPAPTPVLELLLSRRLARPRFDAHRPGWLTGITLASAVLVDCLAARAQLVGRWQAHHAACARLFAGRSDPGSAERLGRHLAGAGRPLEALTPLATAARLRLAAGEYLAAASLLEQREHLLGEAGLPGEDPRWGEGWTLRARLLRARGEFLEADAWAARAEAGARRHDWHLLLSVALLERGRLAWHLGEPEIAAERLTAAHTVAARLGDARLAAECEWQLADLASGQGRLAAAAERFDRARTTFIALGDHVSAGKAGLSLGEVARQAGHLAEAVAHVEAARGWLRLGGAQWGEAECANKLGELARLGGDTARAAACYREAADLYRNLGSGMAIYPQLNLGVVEVEEGQYARARPVLEDVLNIFVRQGTRGMVGAAHVCLMACCAGLDDAAAFDLHRAEAEHALSASGFVDVDNARLAELAGDLWELTGDTMRAQLSWHVAREQWRALGRGLDAERLDARLP
jgi:serine/threonine protein kinase/tetratricopeptide (TPR) repeat protein